MEQPIHLTPVKFYALVDLVRTLDAKSAVLAKLEELGNEVSEASVQVKEDMNGLSTAYEALTQEEQNTTRRRQNPFADQEEEKADGFGVLRASVGGDTFLGVILDIVHWIDETYDTMGRVSRMLQPESLFLSKRKEGDDWITSSMDFDMMEKISLEISMNRDGVSRFMSGVQAANGAKKAVSHLGGMINRRLDNYYYMLEDRHSVKGVKIHQDPVTTDLAISIYKNIDAHGEIEDGKDENQLSAYSANKAIIVASAATTGLLSEFCADPMNLIDYLTTHMKKLWAMAGKLDTVVKPFSDKMNTILGSYSNIYESIISDGKFNSALTMLRGLDPQNVKYREKTGLISPEERFALNFENDTLEELTSLLVDKASPKDIVAYVLERKKMLRDYYRDENSFYVCKVGSGNPFLGVAPGALEIVPGTRPNVDLGEIVGSGFEEVKHFIESVEMGATWQELFLATSPSKTADKSNVLLIGPPGCGKSEILRAVGGDKKSVGIFAVGSDFLTCWKGEAEKNPKRLFEGAYKLQKESKKHVHILIDEIDTILNKDQGRESFGATNLVTEFQNLMDGVVHYPNLSVWGATNHPDRIPMPMIRRFSKVLIVGELTREQRGSLLLNFVSYMPTKVTQESMMALGDRLEGATGDVIRKVIDHIWREKMTAFVRDKPKFAKELRNYLQKKSEEKDSGEAFRLEEFLKDGDRSKAFKKKLEEHVLVTEQDVEESIELHLSNVAIRSEISTAQDTYKKAKDLLQHLKKTAVNGGASAKDARGKIIEEEAGGS